MAVVEPRRIRLFERLAAVLGHEDAVTMLEMLPPAGQDTLTRDDLDRALAPFVTKDDLDRALSHYATKADLYRIFTAQTIALAAVLGAAAAFFG